MNYNDLLKQNWISVFSENIKKGIVKPLDDGRFLSKRSLMIDVPWLYVNFKESYNTSKDGEELCDTYHEYFTKKLGFIHSHCHECYKVVVQPRTIKELYQLYKVMQDLKFPSKCGIEIRSYVPRLYGGYFYNRGLNQGKDRYSIIKTVVHSRISPEIEVILKRGCSEFEMQFGRSDKWRILDGQEKIEEKFNNLYIQENAGAIEYPSHFKANTKIMWLYFAANAKPPDMTYLEFTDGEPLTPQVKYVTYHETEIKKSSKDNELS